MPSTDLRFSPLPGRLAVFAKLLTLPRKGLRSGDSIGRFDATTDPVVTDFARLKSWCDMTGYTTGDLLPLPWSFVPAQALTMAVIADSAWPLKALGMVHIRQTISQWRPVKTGKNYDARVFVEGHETARQGRLFNFVTELHQDGELCQTVESRYLARGGGDPALARDTPLSRPNHLTGPTWHLPADAGRQYAGISGDYNPIHLWAWSARLLGFKQQIIHGMAAAAKMTAVMEHQSAWDARQPRKLDIAFKKPMFLPGTIIADIEAGPDKVQGNLWPAIPQGNKNGDGQAPHILSTLEKLA